MAPASRSVGGTRAFRGGGLSVGRVYHPVEGWSLSQLLTVVLCAQVANREIKRLKRMSPIHSEYSTLLDYLDWLAELPWNVSSTEQLSISAARKQLEEDHYGMEKASHATCHTPPATCHTHARPRGITEDPRDERTTHACSRHVS